MPPPRRAKIEIKDAPKPTPERPFENLVHLQHIAEDIEAGNEVDQSLEPYFFHGSGLGGARPKTLIVTLRDVLEVRQCKKPRQSNLFRLR